MHSVSILLALALFGFLSSSTTPRVQAQTTVFEDSFEDGLTNWQPVRDDGRYWKVLNQSLEAYVPFRSIITELVPLDAAWNNNWKNIELAMKFLPLQGADKNISFGYKDAQNWYELHFTPTFTEVVKITNGVVTWIDQTGTVLPNGISYDLKLQFNNGKVTFYANDLLLFSFTDPHFNDDFGKIGLKASTGSIFPTKIIFDDIVIKNLDIPADVSLGIQLLRQTDALWAEQEYDTATAWLQSTTVSANFKDWACNLISQVMLLRHHGITKLPDGSDLTPISFNEWLLENNGYIDSPRTGNINRHSISSLSSLVSEKLGTPKLEYAYVNQDMITAAIAEIDKGNPVILQLDGHFVLADGYTADKTDLLIKDPAYAVTKLSEHPLPLLSLRLYTPSQTDLSYISIHTDPESQVTLTPIGESAITVQSYQEYQHAASNSEVSSPKVQVTDIAKPASADFSVAITPKDHTNIEILAIDKTGVSQELISEDATAAKMEYQLHYDKNGLSSIESVAPTPSPSPSPSSTPIASPSPTPSNNFAHLKTKIVELHAKKEIKKNQFKNLLLSLITSVENTKKEKNQVKLLKVAELVVISAPKIFITSLGKLELLAEIKAVIKILR